MENNNNSELVKNIYKLNHNDIVENLVKNVELISNKSDCGNSKLMTNFDNKKNKLTIVKFKNNEILEYVRNMMISIELYNFKLLCDVLINSHSNENKTKLKSSDELINEFFSIEGCARGTMLNEKYFFGLMKDVCTENSILNNDLMSVLTSLVEFSKEENEDIDNFEIKKNVNIEVNTSHNSELNCHEKKLDDENNIIQDKINENKKELIDRKKYDLFYIVNMLATICNSIYQKIPRSKLIIKNEMEKSAILNESNCDKDISSLMSSYKIKITSILILMEKYITKHISDFIVNIIL